jgi:hypothetical protein
VDFPHRLDKIMAPFGVGSPADALASSDREGTMEPALCFR